MAVTLRVGESGKRHRMSFSFDMSSNTSLALVYTKPDESTLSVTPTLGTSSATIDGESVAANTWAYYDFEPGDIASGEDGTWTAQFTYTNTASSPNDVFKNLIPIILTVSP